MISDIFVMSLDALRSHKVRTFLTLLGVIIGISSVIMVTAGGNSVKAFIEEQWNIFDPTGMIIGTGTASNPPQIQLTKIVYTTNDVEKIKNLPHIDSASPIGIVPLKKIMIKEGFLKWTSKSGGTMYASTPAILDVLDLKIGKGQIFQDGKNEIVITESATMIFGKDKKLDVGNIIYLQRIDGRILEAKIVGIIKDNGNVNVLNQLTAPSIIGPVDPYYSTYLGSNVGGIFKRVTAFGLIYANAIDKQSVDIAKNEIIEYLNSDQSDANQYKDKNSDFVVITQQYILNRVDQIVNVLRMFITAIALISLVVGSIGIANIMYATVTERTREIGTMMALGAKRKDILQLYLYQSAMIGLFGGVLGCILGGCGSVFVIEVINNYLNQIGGAAFSGTITLLFSYEWFVIAVFFGIVVGIIAGVLPARKAAKMDPVIALRYS
jgi:putative ABC transport system permease protein